MGEGVSPSLPRNGSLVANHLVVSVPFSREHGFSGVFSLPGFQEDEGDSLIGSNGHVDLTTRGSLLQKLVHPFSLARKENVIRSDVDLHVGSSLCIDLKVSALLCLLSVQSKACCASTDLPIKEVNNASTAAVVSGVPVGIGKSSSAVAEIVVSKTRGLPLQKRASLPQELLPTDHRDVVASDVRASKVSNADISRFDAAINAEYGVVDANGASNADSNGFSSDLQCCAQRRSVQIQINADVDGVAGANDAFKAVSGCFSSDLQVVEVPISDLFRSEGHVSPKTWRGLPGLFACGYSSTDPIVEGTTRRAVGHKSALSDANPGLFAACYGSRGPYPVNGEGKDDVVGFSGFRSTSAMSVSGGFLNEWRQDSPSVVYGSNGGRLLGPHQRFSISVTETKPTYGFSEMYLILGCCWDPILGGIDMGQMIAEGSVRR